MADKDEAPPLPPPDVLGDRGRKLWLELTDEFDFDPQEVQLLLETCRTLDQIDALQDSIATNGVMVSGSQGQPVLNAAVAELRQQQTSYGRLVGQLNLLDAELGQAMTARARAARTAGQARWREGKKARIA
jgi:P27 family predicted phage terminase small subunit